MSFDYDADSVDLAESINQISVSGVQEKLSAVVQNGQIVLTPQGEHGRYIIKPAPSYKNLRFRSFIPANEHLTMQIAKQVYKMKVAENGIVFFANGDAHQKNFSLQQSANGDYLLSPAYDLMNTSIHVQDEDFALQDGLIPKREHSEIYSNSEHPCKEDFITYANHIGVLPKKRDAIIKMFSANNPLIEELIDHSFLDDKTKRMYKRSYQERLNRFLR